MSYNIGTRFVHHLAEAGWWLPHAGVPEVIAAVIVGAVIAEALPFGVLLSVGCWPETMERRPGSAIYPSCRPASRLGAGADRDSRASRIC